MVSDLIAANRAYFWASLRTRRMLRSYAVGGFIFGLMSVGFAWNEPAGAKVIAFLGGVLLWTFFLGIFLSINYVLLPRRTRRIFAQQKNLHNEVALQWGDGGVSFQSEKGSSKFAWSDFIRIAENRNAIILLQSDALFNFIPKRVLSADDVASIMVHRT
ncbi:YcxB family protein [Sphingomonas sanguinis]|uniref:YcxB family protein n=1 Tax=Sphingomonas sanguinis TaxID=33051 RepID=UPI001C56B271|nr:YcxB family protein [Sphingomonas sanguinis]QXT34755.1 YcxB family protein [Sphingomonas sanguinis]